MEGVGFVEGVGWFNLDGAECESGVSGKVVYAHYVTIFDGVQSV